MRRLVARPQHVLLFVDREMSNGISIAGQRHACRQNNRQLSESTTYCIVLTTRVCAEGKGTFIFPDYLITYIPQLTDCTALASCVKGVQGTANCIRMFNDTRLPIVVNF